MRAGDRHDETAVGSTRYLCILAGPEPEPALALISAFRRRGLRVSVWHVGGALEVEGGDEAIQRVLDEESIVLVCRWRADRPRFAQSPCPRAEEPAVARILNIWEVGLNGYSAEDEDTSCGECAAPYVHLEASFLVNGLGGLPASETILEAVTLFHQDASETLTQGRQLLDPDVERVLRVLLEADAKAVFDESVFEQPGFDEAPSLFPSRRKLHGTIAVMLSVVRGEHGFETGTPDQVLADVLTGMRWLVSHHPTGDLTFAVATHEVAVTTQDKLQPNQDEWLVPARQEICRAVGRAKVETYLDELKEHTRASERLSVWLTSCRSKHFARTIGRDVILAERQAPSCSGRVSEWGGRGRARLPLIAAHELLHPFGALDEYAVTAPGHGYPSYLTQRHDLPNGNVEIDANEPSRHRPCVMNGFAQRLCEYTRAHIGWARALLVIEAGSESSECSLAVVASVELVEYAALSFTRPRERQALALELPETWTLEQGLELVVKDPGSQWHPAVVELWIDDRRMEGIRARDRSEAESERTESPSEPRRWKLV